MTLNDKIKTFLDQANISYSIDNYQTGQPNGQEDQILHWDAKLGSQPTADQLANAQAIKEAADLAISYKNKRAVEYLSIVDQLDLIFHGGLDAWKESIQAVKDKYPKK